MRVCHLINRLSSGGAQSVVIDIVENSDGIDHTICCLEPSLEHDLSDDDTRVVNFDERFKFDPRAVFRLLRFLDTEQFDVLHLHLPYSQVVGRAVSLMTGPRCVVSTFHSHPENYHPVTRWLERITRPVDSASVAVSVGVQRSHDGTERVYDGGPVDGWCTIYNGIDVEAFRSRVRAVDPTSLRRRHGVGDGPVYLNASRYVREKSQRDAILAMEELVTEQPEAMLFIVGRGPLQEELQSLVDDLGLTDNVRIPGFVMGDELFEYFAASDAFILPSITEGFGIVLVEAMAASLPVVATDIPGVNEIVVDGQTGRLVPPNDPKTLAEAMVAVVEPDARREYGEAGGERARRLFDAERTVGNYVDLYRNLAGDDR